MYVCVLCVWLCLGSIFSIHLAPGCCRKAIVPAAFIIAVLGAVSAYTFVLIGRSCAETGAESYEQSWARTVGQKSAWMPAGACVATCFAGCLAFTIIIGDSFAALAKTFGAPALVANRSNIIMAVSAAVLLPLSLLKSASVFLRPLYCTWYALVCTICRCCSLYCSAQFVLFGRAKSVCVVNGVDKKQFL